MRVLVTGGAGYIGSHTCKRLAEVGNEPVVFDNLSTGHRSAVRFGPFIEGDILDGSALERALSTWSCEAVVHFAASAYVGESMRDPLGYYRNNVAGTLSLLRAMATTRVEQLVFSSSCATYGAPEILPITEDTPQSPINPYGETKLIGEWLIRAQCNASSLRAIALRYFNAAGADPDGELGEDHDPETHLIPLTLAATLPGAPALQAFGSDYQTPDGSCVRDYLHVSDLADAHALAMASLTLPHRFRAYNLGTGQGYSVRDIVEAAGRASGMPATVQWVDRRPGDPPILVADPSRAFAELGWQPIRSNLDTILTTAWRWMRGGRSVINQPGP